jgi:DNA-binding MarR family transcriptional regulator
MTDATDNFADISTIDRLRAAVKELFRRREEEIYGAKMARAVRLEGAMPGVYIPSPRAAVAPYVLKQLVLLPATASKIEQLLRVKRGTTCNAMARAAALGLVEFDRSARRIVYRLTPTGKHIVTQIRAGLTIDEIIPKPKPEKLCDTRKRLRNERLAKIHEFNASGATQSVTARALDIPPQTLRNIVLRHGIIWLAKHQPTNTKGEN